MLMGVKTHVSMAVPYRVFGRRERNAPESAGLMRVLQDEASSHFMAPFVSRATSQSAQDLVMMDLLQSAQRLSVICCR
ncbi:hypothetical protein NXC24_PB00175 (plasmid) [Rhizobium sp. NXC24]|nr:hypothetical protein NXC24_PB00175 [Rhizobium sp. NXC24]